MSPRYLFPLPLLILSGCVSQTTTSTTPAASLPVSSLPRHRHLAEVRAAGAAELLRPAPTVSDLTPTGTARFIPPPPGSLPANYLASLSDSRPKRGLVICEPQGIGTKNFGAGCARWMSEAGASSPAFEVVPTWGVAGAFMYCRGWKDLALERGRAVQLARGLDASHVAIGSFDGKQLQYQLLSVQNTPSQVISSFTIKGSPAQIVAQLPRLTRQLVDATGIKGVQIPSQVGLTADDLSFLGSLPRDIPQLQALKPTQISHLTRLADQPLGAIFLGRVVAAPLPAHVRAAQTLLKVAPTNALAACEVARYFGDIERQRRTQILRALDHQFPRNEAIALGNASLRADEEDYVAQVHYAEMAVRVAPHAPVAWNELAQALYSQADQEREGLPWRDMSRKQQAFVLPIYPRSVAAAWKAVDLDSKHSNLWTTLSKTSTFGNSPQWARDALAQALKCDPQDEEALNWGIEIFQPKWFGNAASFATMARLAVANAGRGELDADALCLGLRLTDQQALKRPLLQKLVAKEPNNVPALREYSYAVRMDLGDSKAALPYARRAVQLAPDDTQALTELADIEQHDLGQYAESIKLFRRAIQVEPKNPLHWVNMALSYAKWGKLDEARTDAIKGRALGYHGPHPVWKMVGLSPDGSDPVPTRPAVAPRTIQ